MVRCVLVQGERACFARCAGYWRLVLRVNSGVRVKVPPKGRGAVIDAVLHTYGIVLSLFIHNFVNKVKLSYYIHNFVNKVNPPPVLLKP